MTLKQAIDRSISHDEIVTVNDYPGDSGDALAELERLIDSDEVEIDSVLLDHEGIDTLDVWASRHDDTDMEWRLNIQFSIKG